MRREKLTININNNFLKEFDLELNHDGEGYYINTLDDREVGIFGYILSPRFKELEDLEAWVEVLKEVFSLN